MAKIHKQCQGPAKRHMTLAALVSKDTKGAGVALADDPKASNITQTERQNF